MPLNPTVSYNYPVTLYDLTGKYTASSNSGHKLSASTSVASNDQFFTLNGHDYLKGFDGDDRLYSGGGNDILEGGAGNDTLSGDAGDDWLYGDYKYEASFATGDDFVLGGSGNDYLFGGGGNDELNGGADEDTIEGGTGSDVLIGGGGADVFRFDVAAETGFGHIDTIKDFKDGTDKVLLAEAASITNLEKYSLNGGTDTLVIINDTHGIVFEDVAPNIIDDSDFMFA
jgi:Ca2+-binding RTX toxin-like protein